MQCRMEHDQCRATVRFPFAGQNIYMHGTTGEFDPIEQQLEGAVNLWFNEHVDANPSDITNCCGGERFSKIGHFLQLVQDRVVRIGCAALRYSTVQWRTTLVTCNYSMGNVLDRPVYETGPAGSGCRTRDSFYNNLCTS